MEPFPIDVRDHFDTRLNDLNIRLDERAEAQRAAVEAALLAQREATAAALAAADKALTKAETAQGARMATMIATGALFMSVLSVATTTLVAVTH